jgi:GMP synthase-like glutamine amidotransferase
VRLLAFRHVPFEGAGLLEHALSARGFALDYVDLYLAGTRLPETQGAGGLIFLGGPMSVNDDLPYLRTEMELIREAIARSQPVLGICLGAQLIARAMGAKVGRNPQKEIGWFPVRLTAAGAADPFFAGTNRTQTVFHWHSETFDLPAGSVLLASSDACRNQAFRLGDTVYGLQFHLEVTPEMIADWCQQDENCGDVRELEAPLDPWRDSGRLAALASVAFGNWCDRLSGHRTVP